jgi:hypothetical protein
MTERLERGRPQLTVETEANGDSRSTYERGPFVGWLGLSCRYKSFCSALAALVGAVQNIFYLPVTIFIPLFTSPTKLSRHPCWEACLLVCLSAYIISLLFVPIAQQAGQATVPGLLSLNI